MHYTGFYYTPENNERKQEEKRRRRGNKTTMNTLIKFSTLSEKYSEVEEHGKIRRTGLWHIQKPSTSLAASPNEEDTWGYIYIS